MLSKPKAGVSAGKLSAGRRSTPSRSRRVLLYSARLSRRAVTRPASGFATRSCRANSDSSQWVTPAMVAAGGIAAPGGGIWPVFSFSATFSQSSRLSSNVLALWRAARSTSPDLTLALWQATQLVRTNENTSGDSAPGASEAAARAAARMVRIRVIGGAFTMLALDGRFHVFGKTGSGPATLRLLGKCVRIRLACIVGQPLGLLPALGRHLRAPFGM